MKWDRMPLEQVLTMTKDKVPVEYGVRYYEAETAEDHSIPFDYRWYSIDVITREQMIASRLARVSVSNLVQKHSMRKVH